MSVDTIAKGTGALWRFDVVPPFGTPAVSELVIALGSATAADVQGTNSVDIDLTSAAVYAETLTCFYLIAS